jgi:hypothetical protein
MTTNWEAAVEGQQQTGRRDLEQKGDEADHLTVQQAEDGWSPTPEWVESWKNKLPLQTIMRVLQILVPQVEKICIDKGLTDESEILKFLQHGKIRYQLSLFNRNIIWKGTLVGLLPVPHPILIRKYIANTATNNWFRTYMWGVIYLR